MAEEWRRVVAVLADPVRRRLYAGVVLGVPVDVPVKKKDKALKALVAAGLLRADGDEYVAVDGAFAELLAASPVVTRTGVERFVRDGRIEQYPVKVGDRVEVLVWARDRVLPEAGEISERKFGERLSELTGDVATLRRYLVDAGLVERDAAGSRYWRKSE
ncbi:MAG TPA: DUF2087 domain-containing protein [Galbitalea sp.]|jgi:hypothetical protein|nr:DUF2087 domain-containing protein [Galbitalea sp.]